MIGAMVCHSHQQFSGFDLTLYPLGMPVAWMLPSNGTQATLELYLKQIRVENPTMIPKEFMSDKDRAQMNTIKVVYSKCDLFLCWWHVLHAWQAHFTLMHFPILWDLLKKLIHVPTVADFDNLWHTILDLPAEDCPPLMIEYLETNWMQEKMLWSAIFHQERSIFDACDTNMLVEASVIMLSVLGQDLTVSFQMAPHAQG